ncbi:flagellar protein FlgN [Occultella glacieicola]|uniref:Flagellar protein FlgN n=1 Tax=Occultella glacieicola TaxID=2518684 RepID=A0ABY2E3Z6_9MICO|nr:flagellar protein FlgN [Occultella glacieicola]TDE94742.1 flagellar protein FlgN [Occultella glacieicola]
MGAQELSAAIWHQRNLLELLLFKLTEEQLLLTAGRTDWLANATREVEQVVERLYESGLARDVEAAGVAGRWGAADGASLRELIQHAPSPWDEVLTEHLTALTSLTARIRDLRDANAQFLRTGLRATQETLAGLDGAVGTYDSHGASRAETGAARLVDKRL